jgi:hypothetical protein
MVGLAVKNESLVSGRMTSAFSVSLRSSNGWAARNDSG